MKETAGTLYLIPTPLDARSPANYLPEETLTIIRKLKHFVCETPKIARQHLAQFNLDTPIHKLLLFELNENSRNFAFDEILKIFNSGQNIGLVSDAGAPAVADPGAKIVQFAHRNDIRVVPIIGPSSILLALMGSGLEGQRFRFNGYIPSEKSQRQKAIKDLETGSSINGETEILMETPYRSHHLFNDILMMCYPETLLAIAADITTENEYIRTAPIQSWRNLTPQPDLKGKKVVFLIQAKRFRSAPAQQIKKSNHQKVPRNSKAPRRLRY